MRAHSHTHTTLYLRERQITHPDRNLFLGNTLRQHVTSFHNWSVSNYATTFRDWGSKTKNRKQNIKYKYTQDKERKKDGYKFYDFFTPLLSLTGLHIEQYRPSNSFTLKMGISEPKSWKAEF
jgi:hypothetical protein